MTSDTAPRRGSSTPWIVLVASIDPEVCVAETVRRQMTRPFARSRDVEEAVIRERLPIYAALRARTIETMRPRTAVVDELVAAIRLVGWSAE